jgi:hypothetical protein
MHAETEQFHTTVGLAVAARNAFSAGKVRLDGAMIADFQTADIRSDFNNLDTQLVTETTRIGEKRLTPFERMKVGPADAEAAHFAQSLSRTGLTRMCGFADFELTRLFKHDLFHDEAPLATAE